MTEKPKRRTKPNGIMLDKTFRIVPIDDKNVELQEYTSFKDKGEEVKWNWASRGFYHSTTSAIKAYCNLRTIRCKTKNDLLTTMEDIHNKIDKFFEISHGCKKEKKDCGCYD